MDVQACVIDSDESLRKNLMSLDPMQRTLALHALEIQIARNAGHATTELLNEVAHFTERGIPFYSLRDPHFCEWVGQAVLYWQRLRAQTSAPRAPKRQGAAKKKISPEGGGVTTHNPGHPKPGSAII